MKSSSIAHTHMKRDILRIEVLDHSATSLFHELLSNSQTTIASLYSLFKVETQYFYTYNIIPFKV